MKAIFELIRRIVTADIDAPIRDLRAFLLSSKKSLLVTIASIIVFLALIWLLIALCPSQC